MTFYQNAISFLGHIVSDEGVEMEPSKVKGNSRLANPKFSSRYSMIFGIS